jgi:hypothetical protein
VTDSVAGGRVRARIPVAVPGPGLPAAAEPAGCRGPWFSGAVRSVADTVAVTEDREPTPKRSRMCPMVTSVVFSKGK